MSTQKNIRVRVYSTKANQFTGEIKFKNGIKINEQLRKLKYKTDLYKEYKATIK